MVCKSMNKDSFPKDGVITWYMSRPVMFDKYRGVSFEAGIHTKEYLTQYVSLILDVCLEGNSDSVRDGSLCEAS